MTRFLLLSTVALLTGCASRPAAMTVAAVPIPVAPSPPPVAPTATPINAGLSPAATLWHLRSGLNVAALACRGAGEAQTVARYNALLAREATALRDAEAAYAAEFRAGGGAWRDRYDDEMTRLYNFFGQARGRADFCAAADRALAALEAMPAGTMPDAASAQLASLDQPFAPPWLAVDPAVFGGAPVRVAAR